MRVLSGAIIICTAALLSACTTHTSSKADSAKVLASSSTYSASRDSGSAALKSYMWGDKYTAANLFLQAYEADPSIQNRFNLATGFSSIGKNDAAAAIYRGLVKDGEYVRLSEVHPRSAGAVYVESFNVAHESQRRRSAIEARGPGPTGSIGGGTGTSNEEARLLDLEVEQATKQKFIRNASARE